MCTMYMTSHKCKILMTLGIPVCLTSSSTVILRSLWRNSRSDGCISLNFLAMLLVRWLSFSARTIFVRHLNHQYMTCHDLLQTKVFKISKIHYKKLFNSHYVFIRLIVFNPVGQNEPNRISASIKANVKTVRVNLWCVCYPKY